MKFRTVTRAGTIMIVTVLIAWASISAGEGGLDPAAIEKIRDSYKLDAQTRSMYNAITNNDINDLALNRELLRGHDEMFSHKIKVKGITNQKSTGRCWLFAGLNVMRPLVIKKHKLNEFEFSESFLQFWDKMEKANNLLENMIEYPDKDPLDREMEILLRDPIPDGGWWQYVVALIEKYGVVPLEIMPETKSSEKTGMMNKLLAEKLRIDAARLRELNREGCSVGELRAEKESMMGEIYRMLAMNMGEPPTEFQWRYEDQDSTVSSTKTYTPQSFFEDFVDVDLNQYVSLFNDPSKDYGAHYAISMSRNIFDGRDIDYANLDIDALKNLTMKSVLDDEPVWFACDVGKDQSRDKGIMAMDIYDYGPIYNIDMGLSKAERVIFRDSAPNHAMVFVGVDVKDKKPVKWLVENSWGTDKGSGGYWTLYDSWFDNHVYEVIIDKKHISEDVMKIYEQDPVILPPWDPMYSVIR
jgi:bleomycin hydrolase